MSRTRSSLVLLLVIILATSEQISSSSQFCSTLHTTTKQDTCPTPSSFNILDEYKKPSSAWKLNMPILMNGSDINLIEEIKTRFNHKTACPYIRKTNKTICCDGWQGLACDQAASSLAEQTFATCRLWGRDHIRTFDGTLYRFPGSCTYKLVGSATWQINVEFINCTASKSNCQKKLTAIVAGKTLEIIGTKIHNLTSYPSSLTIRRQDKHLLDLHFTNGLRLKFDQQQQTIAIQLDQNLMVDQSLSGLCGDYNSKPEDDLKLVATGVITTTPVDFGNQWKLDGDCPDVSAVISSCAIAPEAMPAAMEACRSLTNDSTVFDLCWEKVDATYFYDACMNDVCSANQPCGAFEAYVEECHLHNVQLVSWRSEAGCSKQCASPNMIYADCASACPATCQNPTPMNGQCHSQNKECTAGCVCSNGTVYDSARDECVPLEQCSCLYNNEQYQAGDRVSMDCNDCTCDQGRWACTNRTCPRTCLVLGDMNIWTFDGKQYALTSECNQVLVEASNYVRITYNNKANELSVQILNTKIILRQSDVLVDGNIRHTLPYQTDDAIVRHASTAFTEVRDMHSTVVVHFDPITSRVYVKLQPSFINRVRGLCGTFNYVTNDDFLTPNNVIETSLASFANAYLASPCSIPDQQTDTCLNFPANERNARLECTELLKHPSFSSCSPQTINPAFFLAACTRDLCQDQSSTHRDEVKCSVIAALAHACASKGILIDWMKNDSLASTCRTINYGQCSQASGSMYSECVAECQSSCTDIDVMPSSCIAQCVPGCQCRSGEYFDAHSLVCRTRIECPCFESRSEQYVHPSHSLLIKTPIQSNCSCFNGSLQCTSFEDKQCSGTQIYSLNTTRCPRTCANYMSHYDCTSYGPGCTCPPGQILLDSAANQQTCIPSDQCPCQYNRRTYLENESILQNDHGCQNCTCQRGGAWSCQKVSCTKTCTIFGHAHYQTFDGLYYNFPGQCQYIVAKDSKSLFRILSQNIPCGASGQICSKNVFIEYNGVTIDLIRGRPILVNNIELLKYDVQPVTLGAIHIYQVGIYTVIKTKDFTVRWDGKTYVDITVSSNNDMSGLCGNNNDNTDDDLKTANGATQVSTYDMAKSWQTSAQCVPGRNQSENSDPCGDTSEHEQRRAWARNQCDLIKIKASVFNNPFEKCIDKMEASLVEKYYQACLYDACHADHGGDCEAVCTVLSAFAGECQSIVKAETMKWRTADRCPMQCDAGKVYMACGPRCPQSCFEGDDYGGCIAESGCVDGCFCPHGQVMDSEGQCVEPRRCPCAYDNKVYPQSTRIRIRQNETCSQECECQNGSFVCDKNAPVSCKATSCTSNQFTCKSDGQCIPLNWRCDRVADCADGSDESKGYCQDRCLNQTRMFSCASGQCIDATRRCDGLPDCRDGSDELNCTYVVPCREYECPVSKTCIPKAWLCDGTVDCGREDSADESGDCQRNQCDTLSGRYFQCRDNGNCLPIDQRCDAHKDCNDGSDEANCSSCTCTSSFSCLSTCQCVDSRRVCDGLSDCIDGTDEYNCSANCAKEEYTCLDGKCLNRTLLCDGIRHCSKGEDETHPDCIGLSTQTVPTLTTGTPEYPDSETKNVSSVRGSTCDIQTALIGDRFIAKPTFSTPIVGPVVTLNPGSQGIDFVPPTAATTITITLPLTKNTTIVKLARLQILRPSNVQRFQLTFLNRKNQPIGQYQIISTDSQNASVSPTIDEFPLQSSVLAEIRALRIQILSTTDERPPKQVTILFEACFVQTKSPVQETCSQIDAMDSRYTTQIVAKLGGTRPINATVGHLLRGYGGVTFNTSQAVIDVRLHKRILSRLSEISIPDYRLKRTNVKKVIVELFDQYHTRLFHEKSSTMVVKMNFKKRLAVRFIRVSILETKDNYAPFNVTLSVKGCFYKTQPKRKPTKKPTTTTTTPSPSTCFRANALDTHFAHKIISQFEGTLPATNSSFLNFIESSNKGVNYAVRTPVIIIRFQPDVVGQLFEISLVNRNSSNVKQFQIDLLDFNGNALFSNQSIYPEYSIKLDSSAASDPLLVSTVQITIVGTIDDRPARGIIFSILGCFSRLPQAMTTTTTSTTTTTTVAPTTVATTTAGPRKCTRQELMNSSNIILGLTSPNRLISGSLAQIKQAGVSFVDAQPSIDIVFHANLLISLNSISMISSASNLKRMRIELLNNENDVQFTIESSSMVVTLESLPSIVLAGVRLTLLQTTDDQPPRNIVLSIDACVEEIVVTTPATTTLPSTTERVYPSTTPITPDHCVDVDVMQQPHSARILAGLSGSNPRGVNASLLDLVHGQSVSFDKSNETTVVFVVFKPELFVYLKQVGLLPSSVKSNVKRMRIDYLDANQLRVREVTIDYSSNRTETEPIQDIAAIRFTIEETYDGQPAENVRLSVRGCFGIPPPSTTTGIPAGVSSTTPAPCQHMDLMADRSKAKKIIGYFSGTNPRSSSIFDYFNASTPISYAEARPTLIIVFKADIYAELKSITITSKDSNVRKYQIDVLDSDRAILQTTLVDTQQKPSVTDFYAPAAGVQITYLTTTDGQTPRNVVLSIDGCFGIRPSSEEESSIAPWTTTPGTILSTTGQCHEIDMMNEHDSVVLVKSIAGTLPAKSTNRLTDYFNASSLISYESSSSPITFVIIFKATVSVELQSVSLIGSNSNVRRFRVDLIDDYKSIVQTVESKERLTIDGLTQVGVAAVQITYLETSDQQPPRNIRLSIRGCFGVLPSRRRTTQGPRRTKTTKQKCTLLDAMSVENRAKILRGVSSNTSAEIFSANGQSFPATKGSIDIVFKQGIMGNIANVSLVGQTHNVKKYRVTFLNIHGRTIDERSFERGDDNNAILSIGNVAALRITFLETTDKKPIVGVKLSIHGCFFKIRHWKTVKTTRTKTRKTVSYCQGVELMEKRNARRMLNRVGGTLELPQISSGRLITSQTKNVTQPLFFVLEFNEDIFIRALQKIAIVSESHPTQQIRLELQNKQGHLLKRVDLSLAAPASETPLYSPMYPIRVKYLKVTVLNGTFNDNTTWSIFGCFDRSKRITKVIKTLKYAWWTVSCMRSDILTGRGTHQSRHSLMPSITGTPLPTRGHLENLITGRKDVSYGTTDQPIVIEITFPPGIIGRLYEVGIQSSNVYRIRVQLIEMPNGLLYTLTSPHYNGTQKKSTNPRLTGFPPVHASGIRITLLDTVDQRPARQVKIVTNGCFYKSSVKYTTLPRLGGSNTTTRKPKTRTTTPSTCRYSEWTRWRHCSVSCGSGVQIRARNQLSGAGCNGSLIDYRMCQLQPCMCVLTKEFYTVATGQKVPIDNIVGYLKEEEEPVHIGDILDTGTIIYSYNCTQFVCSSVGIDVRRPRNCQKKCLFLAWSRWSACKGHCGSKQGKGVQYRQRAPLNILVGSNLCAAQLEYRSCRPPPCFGSCTLSPWSKWSRCSKSCNLGTQNRSRQYLSLQPNCADKLQETRDCNPQCCPSKTKPAWTEWGSWEDCSQACNGGERVRYRSCQNVTSDCPQATTCKGSDKQVEPCNTQTCRVGSSRECATGTIMSNCSNACGHTCTTLTCRSCNEPSICVPGCVCPAPLVMNAAGECVELNQCLCQTSDGKTNLVAGQTITDTSRCEDCSCSNGCLTCQPSSKECSGCQWSEWSPFGVCSADCNGTQTRYRSRLCSGTKPDYDYDNRTCSTTEQSYKKGCAQCTCDSSTGQEQCHVQCAVTPDICANITSDPFATYEYVPPADGQCCGSCHRVNKTEPCAVQDLPFERVSSGNCTSIDPIARQQCLGTCISGALCRCCSPLKVTIKQIPMECRRQENNTTVTFNQPMPYAGIESCACQECHANN